MTLDDAIRQAEDALRSYEMLRTQGPTYGASPLAAALRALLEHMKANERLRAVSESANVAVARRTCGPCSRGQHGVCDGPNEFWGNCTCPHHAPTDPAPVLEVPGGAPTAVRPTTHESNDREQER